MQNAKITVLGIGNILLQDEGFGVRVIERLGRRFTFCGDVQLLDGGTLGMELMRFLAGTENLILVDAISGNQVPGAQYEFRNDQVKAYFKDKVSMHELGIQDVLAVLDVLEKPIENIVVLGVQPQSLELGLELTPLIAAQLDAIENKIITQLAEWQVAAVQKAEA